MILFLKICCVRTDSDGDDRLNCSDVIADSFYNTRICIFSNVMVANLSISQINTVYDGVFIHPGLFKTIKFTESSVPEVPKELFHKFFNLERIYLNNSEVTTVTDESFVFAFNLREVYLDNNQITSLMSRAFTPARQIGLIDLSYNLLETINPDAFDRLSQLRRLYLSHNRLLTVPADMFENIPSLSVIKLNNNLLDRVDKKLFRENILIEEIQLSHNKLLELKLEFTGDRLRVIDAHNNNIQRFAIHSELETNNVIVNLSSNQLVEFQIPINFEIVVLNVERNKLGQSFDIVQNITSIPSLRELYMGYNNLAPLNEDVFSNLQSLRYLGIPNIDLRKLDHKVFTPLNNLTILDISYNKLMSVIHVNELKPLINLKSLYINGNTINGMEIRTIKGVLPEIFEIQISDTDNQPCDHIESLIAELRTSSVYIVANPAAYVSDTCNVNGISCHGVFKDGSTCSSKFSMNTNRSNIRRKEDEMNFSWIILAGSVLAGVIGIYVLIKIVLCITATDERDHFTEVAYLSD